MRARNWVLWKVSAKEALGSRVGGEKQSLSASIDRSLDWLRNLKGRGLGRWDADLRLDQEAGARSPSWCYGPGAVVTRLSLDPAPPPSRSTT